MLPGAPVPDAAGAAGSGARRQRAQRRRQRQRGRRSHPKSRRASLCSRSRITAHQSVGGAQCSEPEPPSAVQRRNPSRRRPACERLWRLVTEGPPLSGRVPAALARHRRLPAAISAQSPPPLHRPGLLPHRLEVNTHLSQRCRRARHGNPLAAAGGAAGALCQRGVLAGSGRPGMGGGVPAASTGLRPAKF